MLFRSGFAVDNQFFVGDSGLLAHPVVTEGATSVKMYLPDEEVYYNYFDFHTLKGKGHHTVAAPLESIPLLIRGGHIIPRKDRPRRSSGLMRYDPYTLVVALNSTGGATGELYIDDGETFDYQTGAYIHRSFEFDAASSVLSSTCFDKCSGKKKAAKAGFKKTMDSVHVERVIIIGAPKSWKSKTSVTVTEGGKTKEVTMVYYDEKKGQAAWAEVKNPKTKIGEDWTVLFA